MQEPGWYHAHGDPPDTVRHWDGAEWSTGPTSTQAVSNPQGFTGSSGVQKDGKLQAAGIMSIISGGVVGLFGLFFLIAIQSDNFLSFADDFTGGVLTLIAIVFIAIAGAYLASGIGCVQGRDWGRIFTIVLQGIFLALFLIGLIGAISEGDSDAVSGLIPLAWTGTILGLAWTGKPWA